MDIESTPAIADTAPPRTTTSGPTPAAARPAMTANVETRPSCAPNTTSRIEASRAMRPGSVASSDMWARPSMRRMLAAVTPPLAATAPSTRRAAAASGTGGEGAGVDPPAPPPGGAAPTPQEAGGGADNCPMVRARLGQRPDPIGEIATVGVGLPRERDLEVRVRAARRRHAGIVLGGRRFVWRRALVIRSSDDESGPRPGARGPHAPDAGRDVRPQRAGSHSAGQARRRAGDGGGARGGHPELRPRRGHRAADAVHRDRHRLVHRRQGLPRHQRARRRAPAPYAAGGHPRAEEEGHRAGGP